MNMRSFHCKDDCFTGSCQSANARRSSYIYEGYMALLLIKISYLIFQLRKCRCKGLVMRIVNRAFVRLT